jgi:hypothetical protein
MNIICDFYGVEALNHEICKGVGENGIRIFCFFLRSVLLTRRVPDVADEYAEKRI